jgi:hypothetical protein
MKLWLVVIKDKELYGEPDIGVSIVEGNELAAKNKRDEMQAACANAGRGRCVGRYREIERSKAYRATALLRTPRPTEPT